MEWSDLERGRVAEAIRRAATRSGNWLGYAEAAIAEVERIQAERAEKADEPTPPSA